MSPENIRAHATTVASSSEIFKTSRDVTFDLPFLSKGTPHHKHGFRLLMDHPLAMAAAIAQAALVGLLAAIVFNMVGGFPSNPMWHTFDYIETDRTAWSIITERRPTTPTGLSLTGEWRNLRDIPDGTIMKNAFDPFPVWMFRPYPIQQIPYISSPENQKILGPKMLLRERELAKNEKFITLFINLAPFLLVINFCHLLICRSITKSRRSLFPFPVLGTSWLSLLPLRIFASSLLPSWFSLNGDSRTIMSFQARLLQFFTLYKSISGRPAEVAEHDLALACKHHGRDLLDSYATYVILWALCLFPAIILFLMAGAEGAFAYAFLVAFSRAALGAYTFDVLNRQRAETDAFIAENESVSAA